ncbi:MAG: DinB family protein [Planctomycetota bacterium]
MQTLALLRFQIEMSKNMTAALLADMLDAPMTAPTPNGGNHPTWVAGHLAYSEANLIHHMIEGETNPLIEWKERFGAGSEPTDDADHYPPLTELLAKWDEVRAHTVHVLDSLTEADLDKPSPNSPPGREAFFGTFGKVLSMVALHPLMHRGQVADARRAARREKMMS